MGNLAISVVQARKLNRMKLNQQCLVLLIVITVLISSEALSISVVPTAACHNPKWAVPPALTVIWQRDAHSASEEFTLVSPSVPHKLWLALQRCLSHWLLQKGARSLAGITQLRCFTHV